MAISIIDDVGFHNHPDLMDATRWVTPGEWKTKFTYTFYNHFHPFVGELLEQLNTKSISGLLDANYHESLERNFFKNLYQPNESEQTVEVRYFPKQIDVSEDGAYSIYNWELFFHVPLTIAVHLSKNQRFAEAQRWFHYIFDPTTNDGQFWRFLAFRGETDFKQVDELLRLVSKPDDECSDEELQQKRLVLSGYEQLRNNPFQPHAVARTRFLAYQYCVVMKYLDNLIAWGDSLFRQDTIEAINEAMQIYVLAANLLGPKPERVPPRGVIRAKTFAQLRAIGIDPLGNALVEMEGQFPFNLYFPGAGGGDTDQTSPLFGIGRTLYFCIPRNDKLLGYWDIVADRLFKIRHCMNIEGVVRQLPLFDPPIDPGMLVKAAAAGIDISSLVSGLNQPLAPVRSTLLIQKALEICTEVRGFGSALLAALEKRDMEALALLRQKHEVNIQQLAQDVRYLQWKEAEANSESLLKSRDSAMERYLFYQRLLGVPEEELTGVSDFTLERPQLSEENFDEVYAELVGQYAQDVPLNDYPALDVLDEGKLFLNKNEDEELNVQLPLSTGVQTAASINDTITALLYYIPKFKIDLSYWGIGGDTEIAGGQFLGNAGQAVSSALRGWANLHTHAATVAAKSAGYERRADEWRLQSNLAARELMQIGRQVISSLIREQITRQEYETQKKQIAQSQEIDQFLREKFTNAELYTWMQGELSKLYYEYYKFAFDVARKAEQTMKHEMMRPELDELNFIKFNYWDGGRKGLLSGESLHLDLKRMEMAYYDHNKREYEMTKHVSLRQLDPVALLTLKAIGSCEVTLPEWIFDLDAPGHYMRRIKNVSVSIPAVAGPFTSVNCTLSLLKSTVRRSALLSDDEYARAADGEDARFVDYYGVIESIVTSNAQNDAGLFETLFREERFLPFEGAGAVSTWRLELPSEFRQFDYNTISDVILHLRYTARQGGSILRQKAVENLGGLIEDTDTSGLVQLFSLRHEFATEWRRFVTGDDDFEATIKKDYFPYFVQRGAITLTSVELYAIRDNEFFATTPEGVDVADLTDALNGDGSFELTLAEDDTVLLRGDEGFVFLLFRYSVS